MKQEMIQFLICLGAGMIQWGFGYIKNKWLGLVLPAGFIGYLVIYLLPKSTTLTFGKIMMLFLLLAVLMFIFYMAWHNGSDAKEKKIKKDLEKMEAKDLEKR